MAVRAISSLDSHFMTCVVVARLLPETVWLGTSERIVAALDDFRRLGQLDLFFNHPELLSDRSAFAAHLGTTLV